MKIVRYEQVTETRFDNDAAKGLSGRVLVGKDDGAKNFCMRVFEVDPGGNTPRHRHEWEHEIFFHAGQGEIRRGGEWVPVGAGTAAFVPGNEEHQIRNAGNDTLVFVCLIPSGVPEL